MTDENAWEEQLIAELRANGGSPSGGPLAGHPLMLLYTTGAKSGQRRRSILTYSRDGDDFVVAGTNGGNEVKHPAWLTNVEAEPAVELEAANQLYDATAEVVEGAERDRLWSRHVEQLPWFGRYPAQITGRTIPVVRLRPRAR